MRIIDFADGFESSVEPGTSIPDASHMAVTPVGNLTSDNGQDAFEELQGDIDTINGKIGQANGIASLNSLGKIPDSQIPALAIVDTYVVADIAARDALTVQKGDVAQVTNAGGGVTKTYSWSGTVWIELITDGSLAAHMANTSNPHNVTKNQVGLGNVDNTSDATKNAATATFTNKTMGDALAFTAISTPSTPPSSIYKLYPKTDGKFYYLKPDGSETAVGAGAGGGDFNLISDGDAEGPNIISLTKNTSAAARPDNGFVTSSVSITSSITSTGPLNGVKSWLLTKPASNCQGQQFVIPFTMPKRFRAKVMDINIPYIVNSGTFVAGTNTTDSDAIVYIAFQDPADSIWKFIEPTSMKFLSNSTTISDEIRSTFQTHSSAVNYKLLVHVATTSASAWELEVDDFKVSPSKYVFGTPITDWYVENGSGSWTNSTYVIARRRLGDTMQLRGLVTSSGGTSGGALYVDVPGGLRVDLAKYPGGAAGGKIGIFYTEDFAVAGYDGFVYLNSATQIGFSYIRSASASSPATSAGVTNTAPFSYSTSDFLKFETEFPIVGWSSSVQMSDQVDTRIVAASVHTASPSATFNSTSQLVTMSAATIDTHGSWNGTTTYTIPVSGIYEIKAQLTYTAVAGNVRVIVYQNGSPALQTLQATNSTLSTIGTEGLLNCKVGDTIQLYHNAPNGLAFNSDATINFFDIKRLSGPSAIAATETVNAKYNTSTGQNMASGSDTVVNYDTKVYDSHGAVTIGSGWKFTAPVSGTYRISAMASLSSSTYTNISVVLRLAKNGVASDFMYSMPLTSTGTSFNPVAAGTTSIKLLVGEYISATIYHNKGAPQALVSGDSAINHIEIERTGNY